MKITTKINLLTTAWMLCILILTNFLVFFLFMKNTVTMDENMLFQKAKDIMAEIHLNQSSSQMEETLRDSLTEHSFIRVMGPKNKVILQETNDKLLSKKIKESIQQKADSNPYHFC